jgi:hypothetical protein
MNRLVEHDLKVLQSCVVNPGSPYPGDLLSTLLISLLALMEQPPLKAIYSLTQPVYAGPSC